MEPDEGAEEVRAPPAERDGEARPAADIRQSPRLGRRLDRWGWVALLVGAALFGTDSSGGTSEELTFPDMVLNVIAVAFSVVGLWSVLRGRRHLSWVLPDLEAASRDEGVVLFLRAFSDEREFARKVTSRPLRWLIVPPPVTPSELRTEEEQVARAVAPFGRMVALGPTHDRLPRAGATRSYASDDEWQSKVLAALDDANLVLLVAGAGDQLQWEVEQAVHRDDPTRLVLVVPRVRGQYADFRENVGDLFPKGLPEEPAGRASRVRYVRAVVWFDPDWTPHVELLRGRLPLLRFAARTQRALPRALQHVYERAGVRPPVKNRTTRPRPQAVVVSVVLISICWLGAEGAVFNLFSAVSSRDPQGGTGSSGFVVFLLLCAVPLVVWMYRVLRAGALAILMLQFIGLGSGIGVAMAVIGLIFYGPGLNLIGAFIALRLAVFFFPASLLLMRRDARDWADSRT